MERKPPRVGHNPLSAAAACSRPLHACLALPLALPQALSLRRQESLHRLHQRLHGPCGRGRSLGGRGQAAQARSQHGQTLRQPWQAELQALACKPPGCTLDACRAGQRAAAGPAQSLRQAATNPTCGAPSKEASARSTLVPCSSRHIETLAFEAAKLKHA